jgi:cell division protein FtsW
MEVMLMSPSTTDGLAGQKVLSSGGVSPDNVSMQARVPEGPRSWHVLVVLTIALLGVGVLMVASASMSVDATSVWSGPGLKQLAFAAAGALAFGLASLVPARFLVGHGGGVRSIPFLGLVVAGFACVAVLIPGIGTEVNGAARWLRFGPIRIQPSELAKWAAVLWIAAWLARPAVDLTRFFKGFCVTCVPIGMLCLLVVIEDFGTAALIGLVATLMLVVGGAKLRHLLMTLPPALMAAGLFVAGTPYRMARLTSFLDPWADAQGSGYHMVQSLLSFASGGLTGRGLGSGIQKLGYLPEDTTDFVFAVIAEELGLAGCALVVFMFMGIAMLAFRATRRASLDPAIRLLAFGIGVTISLQAVVNIAVATVSMPTKGMSLPLISAGGSGMIVTCVMLGLLAGILRRSRASEQGSMSVV